MAWRRAFIFRGLYEGFGETLLVWMTCSDGQQGVTIIYKKNIRDEAVEIYFYEGKRRVPSVSSDTIPCHSHFKISKYIRMVLRVVVWLAFLVLGKDR